MKTKYIIKDWMSNIKSHGETFDTFEDAGEHVYQNAEGCQDGDYSDFYVDEIEEN